MPGWLLKSTVHPSAISRVLAASLGTAVLLLGLRVSAQQTTQTPPSTDSSATGTSSPTSNQPRFGCQLLNGQYTVVYYPESQPGQAYPWAVPSNLGGGWSADRRCNEISRRLESYRPDGLLEMRTGVENGYNIVCVTTEKAPTCRIVFTVPPGQDPSSTRDRVFQNLTIADSGQQTQGVTTFTGTGKNDPMLDNIINIGSSVLGGNPTSSGRSGINLRPFLDPADGGTGSQLTGGTSLRRSNPRLNPGNFR
ncbi:MAG: COP23 domain-containing protein [Leptolyngbyaceae cyanobacterium bins.59]|nr:COP23 domain-containing protein [Leptolyngbyaceae cyanobacterium bins.59]